MKLGIAIVNYNTEEALNNCIDSIMHYPPPCDYQIVIVDNNSDDASKNYLNSIKNTHIDTIMLDNNLGFSGANNIAIKKLFDDGCNYILLLNPDTIVNETSFGSALKFIKKNDDIGVLGIRVLLEDGKLDLACRRGFPTLFNSFCKVSGLSKMFPKSKLLCGYNLTYLDEKESYEVDCVVGAYMLIKKDVFDKIGLLDDTFFMYGEDVDFCYRAKKAGFKVFYYADATISHIKGKSSKKSKKARYEFYNSMKIYYNKHFADKYPVLINKFVTASISLVSKIKK